jgi:predicted O-methyltransferase YrrM
MANLRQRIICALFRIADVLLLPLTFLGSGWFLAVRRYGIEKLPMTRSTLLKIGVFPIRNHYYEPQFKFERDTSVEDRERSLPGIDLNVEAQLELLARFRFQEELRKLPVRKGRACEFYYGNRMFGAGDAEYLYSLVRLIKPRRVVEVGCGFSSLMVHQALNQNRMEASGYECSHTCIEPYENPWLEGIGVSLVRQRLEKVSWGEFDTLGQNDVLFIDSSHIIRSGGDVLCEFLEILPRLKRGVYVHIHDIFTPFDYPERWIRQEVRFWNEQYLMEAFLTNNCQYSVVGALCFLSRKFPGKVSEKFPILAADIKNQEPGSFWIMKQ